MLGNEKGGSGKSTTTMHVAIGLIRLGYRVGSIDLDARQGTLTRYLANRFSYVARTHENLPSPNHMAITRSEKETDQEREFEDSAFLDMALHELKQISDYIVIDTPGSDTHLNRLAHNKADILITPINDSLIDLDVLARINPDTFEIQKPSFYAEMVMELQSRRRREGRAEIDWIVMRNRLSPLNMKNKQIIADLLFELSEKFNFHLCGGFGDRVIFRELFLKGLTLLDNKVSENEDKTSMSEIAARQEVRRLLKEIERSTNVAASM